MRRLIGGLFEIQEMAASGLKGITGPARGTHLNLAILEGVKYTQCHQVVAIVWPSLTAAPLFALLAPKRSWPVRVLKGSCRAESRAIKLTRNGSGVARLRDDWKVKYGAYGQASAMARR
jgi:hypothetical protein